VQTDFPHQKMVATTEWVAGWRQQGRGFIPRAGSGWGLLSCCLQTAACYKLEISTAGGHDVHQTKRLEADVSLGMLITRIDDVKIE
jgi:hypothetical protein